MHAQRINPIKPATPAATGTGVTLDGVVRDKEGRPLAAAEVIVDGDHRSITNSRGEFTISGLTSGVIEFTTRRIGYTPITSAVQVDPGTLRVNLAVKLVPIVQELGTMVVEGKRLSKALWQTGFYKRQDGGRGAYFDDSYMLIAAMHERIDALEIYESLLDCTGILAECFCNDRRVEVVSLH